MHDRALIRDEKTMALRAPKGVADSSISALGGQYTNQTIKSSSASHPRPTQSILEIFGAGSALKEMTLR